MNIDEETKKKIQELQILDQHLQNFLMQKQSIQIESNEIHNALSELEKSDEEVYKVIGNIMMKSKKNALSKELKEKQKHIELRINSIEKQEKLIQDKAMNLREEVDKAIREKKEQ